MVPNFSPVTHHGLMLHVQNLGCVTCERKYSTLPFFWDQKYLGFGEAERKYTALDSISQIFLETVSTFSPVSKSAIFTDRP